MNEAAVAATAASPKGATKLNSLWTCRQQSYVTLMTTNHNQTDAQTHCQTHPQSPSVLQVIKIKSHKHPSKSNNAQRKLCKERGKKGRRWTIDKNEQRPGHTNGGEEWGDHSDCPPEGFPAFSIRAPFSSLSLTLCFLLGHSIPPSISSFIPCCCHLTGTLAWADICVQKKKKFKAREGGEGREDCERVGRE